VGSIEADAYSREEVSFLSLVANQVALAVDDALNFDALQHAKEDLRAGEESLRLIVDSIPGLVHTTTAEGKLEFVNRQLLDYFGKTLDELKGWATNDVIHPDDRSHVIAAFTRSIETGQTYDIEQRCRRKDGVYRWFHVRALAVRDTEGGIIRWYTLFTDIDERKQAEEALRQDERELRQLIDFLPQHVMVLDADGHLLEANQMVLDYTGHTLKEMRDKGAEGLVDVYSHPDDAERVWSECQRGLASGAPFEIERRARGKDGRYRWLLFRLSPLRDEQGRVTRWYAAATDIEERKQAEQRLQNENVALREEIDKASMFEEIVGVSPALHAVLSRVSKVAPTDSTVLITGETGTGKELIARAVHKRSQRSSRAFVGVNCAAVPRDLIASELFGHEKGAFTGATQRRLGRFELAEGGTIFLDEVGDLPAETQIALLRVLQEHEFERLGGTGSIRTNVRVIAATNRDLQAAIVAGIFRSDLFYRLNVFPIEVPPLRERQEDIPVLVKYLIDRYARKAGKNIRGVNKRSLELLQSYPWPGNIRELQNVIERSVIVCETESLSVDESWLSRQAAVTRPQSDLGLSRKPAAQEKEIIEGALRESRGRVAGPSGAAAKLGIPGSTLESKIRSLKINKHRFKTANPSVNRF
jgi:formate hydrogenlyase transcriptional activator